MKAKEKILEAALSIAAENDGDLQAVTIRAVCERAGAGLGLVSYHYGGKDGLLTACADRIVNSVIDRFEAMRDSMADVCAREKLQTLGEMTLSYLFSNPAVSRMSIIHDIESPGPGSNTVRTFEAFLPLVAACRPDMNESDARAAAWSLIVQMQQAFLQSEHLRLALGTDLNNAEERSRFHTSIVEAVLGEGDRQ